MAGPIEAGASHTVEIAVTVIASDDLNNYAEIGAADAVDESDNKLLPPNGQPLFDADSAPDAANEDLLTDDVIDNAGRRRWARTGTK